jgi:hypothetical protein
MYLHSWRPPWHGSLGGSRSTKATLVRRHVKEAEARFLEFRSCWSPCFVTRGQAVSVFRGLCCAALAARCVLHLLHVLASLQVDWWISTGGFIDPGNPSVEMHTVPCLDLGSESVVCDLECRPHLRHSDDGVCVYGTIWGCVSCHPIVLLVCLFIGRSGMVESRRCRSSAVTDASIPLFFVEERVDKLAG